jgi:hypothetical protein
MRGFKLYLSGPMTGLPEFNRPEFCRWAQRLREEGFEVDNPAELPEGWTWEAYMEHAQKVVPTCDGIALLPGYLSSKGACLELRWALDAGLPYATVRNWQSGMIVMQRHGGSLHDEKEVA